MIRAFIALPLPDDVRDALEDVQADLDVGRPTAPENFHITLAYLDKQNDRTLEHIHDVLSQVSHARFDVVLHGIGVFGGRDPRVVWAGVEPERQLENLRDRVRRAATRSGVELARERFRPHVTLARFRGRLKPRESQRLQAFLMRHGALRFEPFEAQAFVLYQSTLHSAGAIHEPITRYSLG